MTRHFGEDAGNWIKRFADILKACVTRWDLELGAPAEEQSMNYIVFAKTKAGADVALKIGVPHREMETEIEALRYYGGRHCVRCLDADASLGALLLERVVPGRMLLSLHDNAQEATIAGQIMKKLLIKEPAEHNLPAFAQWVERAFGKLRSTYGRDCGPMPKALIDKAEQVFRDIAASTPNDMLLHGDLHHENLLCDANQHWLAIDPKGVIGAACLEVGRFLQNQLPEGMTLGQMRQRIEQRVQILSAELAETPETIASSGFVDTVLCACWCVQERPDNDVARNIAVAGLFDKMIP